MTLLPFVTYLSSVLPDLVEDIEEAEDPLWYTGLGLEAPRMPNGHAPVAGARSSRLRRRGEAFFSVSCHRILAEIMDPRSPLWEAADVFEASLNSMRPLKVAA